MFGVHPIRWVRRKLRTTTRKVVTALVVVSSAGSGTAVVAPDSLPGRLGSALVAFVQQPSQPTQTHQDRP